MNHEKVAFPKPVKEEPYIINFVIQKYQINKTSSFKLLPDNEEAPPEPKTNYLTDDSDSDLDVFVDPSKT